MAASSNFRYWPGTDVLAKPAKEVAGILGVHPNTIFRWVKAGQLECLRYSRKKVYFTYDQVQMFLEEKRERVEIKIKRKN